MKEFTKTVSLDQIRENVLESCKSRLHGIKMIAVVMVIIILIMLIVGHPKPPFIVISIVLAVAILIAAGPMWIREQKMIDIVQKMEPVQCIVTHQGMAKMSRRVYYHAVYFIYEGKEEYAFDYKWGTEEESKTGDYIYVWTDGKNYVMSGEASLK